MKADPSAQVRLLDLQDLDSRADQLRHQRRSLPETAPSSPSSTATAAELDGQARDARIAVDDLDRRAGQGRRRRRAGQDPPRARPAADRPGPGQQPQGHPADAAGDGLAGAPDHLARGRRDRGDGAARGGPDATLDWLTAQLAETDERDRRAHRRPRRRSSARSTERSRELDGAARADRRASSRPTCSRSTTGSASSKGGVGAAAAARPAVQRLQARPRQRRARPRSGRPRTTR